MGARQAAQAAHSPPTGPSRSGGKALSLYSPTLEPKEPTNRYDLTHFFYNNGSGLRECSVDFGPVRSANGMFYGCFNLSALPEGFSAPNVTDASYMFTDCAKLSGLPDGFSISNATNAEYMCSGCTGLSALPDNFSAPNIVSAVRMFAYCSSLSSLPAGFSAQNVTNANYMFESCSSLSSLPASFSCPNVTDAYSMFSDCSSLSGLPDGFSVPNVTNAYYMFYNCSSLSALPDGFSVSSATDSRSMFGNCSRLSGLPAGFSIPNVMYAGDMFNGCSSLSALPDGFSCPNVTDANSMFSNCSSLSTIGSNVKIANGAEAAIVDVESTNIDKSRITSIGDNFEWFTNAKFSGTWDHALGIRNVFPNATSVGPGWRVYNHYDGESSGGSGGSGEDLDYFYIEPKYDGATVRCSNFSSSYKLSSSLDKVNWTPISGETIATNVLSGTKVYLAGDTSTLGSYGSNAGFSVSCANSPGTYRLGGKILSLYSHTLEPKTLTNSDDLACWQTGKNNDYDGILEECAVDFGPISSFYVMFSSCYNVTPIIGFSCPNAVNLRAMFSGSYGLPSLPAGLSFPNAVDASDMFATCFSLSAIPDGFSLPNVTSTDGMFTDCNSLTTIGSNVKIANGASATNNDSTNLNKSQITSIGDSFEWFTNATFNGTWNPALGIRNVFPNATSVGSGWRVYNHYDGEASGEAPSNLDYFYIEPTEDNATVVCENLDQSYNLSYSLDKSSWTALTGGAQASTYAARSLPGAAVVAEGLPSGAKVYLRGDTSTLGSTADGPGCRFYSNSAFNAGGKALSLYSPALEPKTLTNANDLAYFFSGCETLSRCSVDFGPVRSASSMFSYCSNLKELPVGFSVPNVTGAAWMFDNCTGLSALPAGFSVPNVADTSHMFSNCYSLLALPEGFSAPNVRDVASMFVGCTSLRSIGNGVKVANGPNAASANDTGLDLSQITSIGDNFEWFTHATFNGEWDYSLGIRNVFPNAATVGSGWQAFGHTASEAPAPSGADLDYFYIMPLADGADAVCQNFSQSYNLSYSLDKSAWRPLTGSLIASDVRAGTKVYLRGDTSTLGSWSGGPGCRFYIDGGNFSAGGSVLSLYSPTLEPKALTNEYDLAYFFCTKGIHECSVDFGPVRCASSMFEDCGALLALPDGFSAPNMTDTGEMFYGCFSLSELPDGFSIPNVTGAVRMFAYCSSLSSLPAGFSAPNVTNTEYMFQGCSSLSSLPDGFSCPNVTNAIWMFDNCSSLRALPDGFSIPNVTNAGYMFYNCTSLTRIGSNVKVANGAGAASTDNTDIDKSRITSIGDNFEWFTNATFNGTWNPALGIRNVFPNANSVGSGWRVYNHYDGE